MRNVFSRFFFGRAANLANHDDLLCLVIMHEQFKTIDKVCAVNRVTANTNRRCLAKANLRGLVHGFICQSARARNHAACAFFENLAGHDADFALIWGQNAGAVRADEAGFRSRKRALNRDHVRDRNAFGDGNDKLHFGVNRFKDGISREWRGHVNNRRCRASGVLGFGYCVIVRKADMRRAAFAGRYACDHFRAVILNGLFRVERASFTRHALRDYFCVFVN